MFHRHSAFRPPLRRYILRKTNGAGENDGKKDGGVQ